MTIDTDVQTDEKFPDLKYTRGIRIKIIEELTKSDTGVFKLPEDVKEQSTLLKALDGIDKAELGRERIKTDNKVADSNAAVAETIAELYRTMGSKPHPLQATGQTVTREIPSVPDHLMPKNCIPGETAIAPAQGSYDTFTTSMDAPLPGAPVA